MSGGWALGPVFGLKRGILHSARRWKKVVYAVGNGGFDVLPGWVGLEDISSEKPEVLQYTPVAVDPASLASAHTDEGTKPVPRHSIVAVGGTFDHLHPGHKLLLTATAFLLDPPSSTFQSTPRLIVGLTGPQLLLNKKHSEHLESWLHRAHTTLSFLTSILTLSPFTTLETLPPAPTNLASTPQTPMTPQAQVSTLSLPGEGRPSTMVVEIVEINDPYGPTITNEEITALVVSEETSAGGAMVNGRRRENGWVELDVHVVGIVTEEGGEGAEKLSSTEIRRRREADRGKGNGKGEVPKGKF
ncbi:hypothetical protein BDZ91DRAFT_712893 [Kalaharituber pfeilii]|nr:hypothetical protein BDZ91DRAFT_712893 [Kalaharituber pfeilii]